MDYCANKVILTGTIVEDAVLNHESRDEKYYRVIVNIDRSSKETSDKVAVVVSEKTVDVAELKAGACVTVRGRFSSRNEYVEGRRTLKLFVFASNLSILEHSAAVQDENNITLMGYVCKEPVLRKTPKGRVITDLMIACNYGKGSSYIPCICWEANAEKAAAYQVGEKVLLDGRIQSREYNKALPDGTTEVRTTYEVSVTNISAV